MNAWEHEGHDRERDRELEDRYEETAEETRELEAWDRIRMGRDTQGEEE